jgi:sulfate transport system permease protein
MNTATLKLPSRAAALPPTAGTAPPAVFSATASPRWLQWVLIALALAFLSFFLFVPLAVVFVEAFK